MPHSKCTPEEIAAAVALWDNGWVYVVASSIPERDAALEAIAAIIHKHKTPAEKAAEKLLEAAQFCLTEFECMEKLTLHSEREPEWWVTWSNVCRKIRVIIAEVKKGS